MKRPLKRQPFTCDICRWRWCKWSVLRAAIFSIRNLSAPVNALFFYYTGIKKESAGWDHGPADTLLHLKVSVKPAENNKSTKIAPDFCSC